MKKPQSLHITKDNHKKYLQLIPAIDRKSLQVNNMFAMSVFANDKPVGLFIADNKKRVLTTENYMQFKQFSNQAILDLINMKKAKQS